MQCPTVETLTDYSLGKLSTDESSDIGAHLGECRDCVAEATRTVTIAMHYLKCFVLSWSVRTTRSLNSPTPSPLCNTYP